MATYRQQFTSGNTGSDTGCPTCVVPLPPFASSKKQTDNVCRSLIKTYYFKKASGATNTLPIMNNHVYSDEFEASPLAAGNYILSTQVIIVVTGTLGLITNQIFACSGTPPVNTFYVSGVAASCAEFCSSTSYSIIASKSMTNGHAFADVTLGDTIDGMMMIDGYYAYYSSTTTTTTYPRDYRVMQISANVVMDIATCSGTMCAIA